MLLDRAPQAINRRRAKVVRPTTIPAPVEGWDASTALATMSPARAVQLKNWFPQPGYIEVRRGSRYHSWDIGASPKTVSSIDTGTETLTSNSHGFSDGDEVKVYATTTIPAGLSDNRTYYIVSSATNTFKLATTSGGSAVDITSAGSGTIYVWKLTEPDVETLMTWHGPASSKMFAAGGGAIWDVTSRAKAVPSSPGYSSNRWQWTMMTTSGGTYLWCCNGTDAAVHYNGTTWAAPSLTGVTATDIIGVNAHKKRLWFVVKDSTKAYYLATEAIAGAATSFELGSLFTRGGYLMAMGTWTRDGGSGADDYAVFVSSRGQVAVYQGTDPAAADTWALVGVFDCPAPIGRRCFTKFGGDLLLITVEGVYPLSQLLSVDQSQVSRVAISNRISAAMTVAAQSYASNWGWEACVYPKGTQLIINIPTSENATAVQYVMNTLTGAWCEFDGMNANSWVVYADNLYYGGQDGTVYQADVGSADVDTPITAVGQTAYSAFGSPGSVKYFSMIRPLLLTSGSLRPAIGVSVDFQETSTLSTLTAVTSTTTARWDSARWDIDVWAGDDVEVNDWTNTIAIGAYASIKFQAQTGAVSGGSLWGVSKWGVDLWGSQGGETQTMKINGFVALAAAGGFI